jgi:hypothetical protein
MSERMKWRERTAWLAVVGVLCMSLAWAGLLSAFALVGTHALPPATFTVARVLGRLVLGTALHAWPLLPVVLLGGMMIAPAVRRSAPERRRMRHV